MFTMCICIQMPKLLQDGITTRIVTVACIHIKSMYHGVQKVQKSKIDCQSFDHKNILLFTGVQSVLLNNVKLLQKLIILAWLQMIVQSLVSQ